MFVNIWLGMRQSAAEVVKTRLNWDKESQGEYVGPITDREYRLFRLMADQANVERLFKIASISGNPWVLWTIPFNKPANVLQEAQNEIDALLLKYPTQVVIGGAWFWDGSQVGAYPVQTAQLLKFMPDDELGNPATILSDVNLSLGQSSRDFT